MMKMRYFILTDAEARDYGGHGILSKEDIPAKLPKVGKGQFYVEIPGDPREWTVGFEDGAAVPVRRVRSAEKARAEEWQAVKAERSRRERGGASTPHGWVDTDETSLARIQLLAIGALVAKAQGKSFSIDFTMSDNEAVTLDADGMIAIAEAVTQHMIDCHRKAQLARPETAQ